MLLYPAKNSTPSISAPSTASTTKKGNRNRNLGHATFLLQIPGIWFRTVVILLSSGFHGQIDFCGHLLLVLFGQHCADQAMALANAGYRAIAYDRRGFGRSSQPWSGYDYDTLADDLAAVIDQTGAKDAVLVGFSMGGGEVARYMSRHRGASVVQAVLVSSVVPYMLQTADNPDGTEQAVFEKKIGRAHV